MLSLFDEQLVNKTGTLDVGASYFMTYHAMMRSSEDAYEALRMARHLADNVTAMLNAGNPGANYEVFPYRFVHS